SLLSGSPQDITELFPHIGSVYSGVIGQTEQLASSQEVEFDVRKIAFGNIADHRVEELKIFETLLVGAVHIEKSNRDGARPRRARLGETHPQASSDQCHDR